MVSRKVLLPTVGFLLLLWLAAIILKHQKTPPPPSPTTASHTAAQAPPVDPKSPYAAESIALASDYVSLMDGTRKPLTAYRGKWLLLNLWATWCGPCRMEMPDLDTIWLSQHPAGLEVLGVSDETADAIWTFMINERPEEAVHYPMATDPGDQIHLDLKGDSIPRTVLINPKGVVVWDQEGSLNREIFYGALKGSGFPVKPLPRVAPANGGAS